MDLFHPHKITKYRQNLKRCRGFFGWFSQIMDTVFINGSKIYRVNLCRNGINSPDYVETHPNISGGSDYSIVRRTYFCVPMPSCSA